MVQVMVKVCHFEVLGSGLPVGNSNFGPKGLGIKFKQEVLELGGQLLLRWLLYGACGYVRGR